ncbi:MAG: hypothetical protein UY56_C0022G0001 [Parcubacteria group bacterium GW2011_GWA1_50_14]|uniref:Uncharacterized protein n=1 Tax=Candidatus Liptonbacteria bacterium GWB1_49_6 TaxID=1798644 RepID=A0A1G2C8L4_9BACT|nr:MAG: hypothetical protein UY56_C0022G0001 [Parcubacteria group bacterium GW2011_GWA1_50_14]OGY96990.1 MAG: hypothetical protein A2122_01215 [Candidatus Liptonbacteria bacterium GWB1_49_6]
MKKLHSVSVLLKKSLGLALFILVLGAGVAGAALTFTATQFTGDGALTINASTTMNIGTTDTTVITVGRAGQTVAFPGNVSSSIIDASGIMEIGTSTATTIAIGRAGQTVRFPGTASSSVLIADTSLTVSTGTAITSHISATASLAFGSISSSTSCNEQTISVTGADTGNTVVSGAPSNVATNTSWSAFVTSTNVVAVRLCAILNNNTTIVPLAGTWRVDVWKH